MAHLGEEVTGRNTHVEGELAGGGVEGGVEVPSLGLGLLLLPVDSGFHLRKRGFINLVLCTDKP